MEAESERQLADPPATRRSTGSTTASCSGSTTATSTARSTWTPACAGERSVAAPVHQCHLAVLQGNLRRRVRVRPAHLLHPPRRAAWRRPRGLLRQPGPRPPQRQDCGSDTSGRQHPRSRAARHEIGHSVESANNGAHGSPAYEIWGDSKWAEFYIYDLYTALGMDREAKDVYRRFTGNTDDFPRRGTRWFRDWFYPLWRDYGRAEVMNRFFRELARHFPRDPAAPTCGGRTGASTSTSPAVQRPPTRAARPPGLSAGPASGPPAGARPRAVPRHHVLIPVAPRQRP